MFEITQDGLTYVAIRNLPTQNGIINPMSESTLAKSYDNLNKDGAMIVAIRLPKELAPQQDNNWVIAVAFRNAEKIMMDNNGRVNESGRTSCEKREK